MNDIAPRPKRRYHRISLTEAQALADEWRSSGLSRAAFARSKGLDVKAVYRCLSRVGSKPSCPSSTTAFIPIENVRPPGAPRADGGEGLSWVLPHDYGHVTGSVSDVARIIGLCLERQRGLA